MVLLLMVNCEYDGPNIYFERELVELLTEAMLSHPDVDRGNIGLVKTESPPWTASGYRERR